ncbi:hypothetical protein OHA77_05950 [Streptosporangium sp. NBC_01639]|uniref:hypothetical protein n=1 Tax=unclassified Streptosporangium TaxID=2632669 RepID=UPI002DD8DB51|nr:hypothetical protein [Streptosporangium sp. NBC_01756]WSC85285.1 hypothetical protein OIE48_33785 [Streptosporangium sp. NBC_01756]WTD56085.1 hypothetical protein OHA77_05950 [Streptosporangium sp. NBC_01639]
MRRMIEVVDDFYQNPQAVRAFALNNCAWTEQGLDRGRAESARTHESFIGQGALDRIAGLLGGEAESVAPRSGSGYFVFAGDPAGEPPEPRVEHALWMAVVYLTPAEHCSGGISFFRSSDRRSGEQAWVPDPWTETLHVSMRFNRMVLYRASGVFHRDGPGFGSHPASGRIAQLFSFDKAPG